AHSRASTLSRAAAARSGSIGLVVGGGLAATSVVHLSIVFAIGCVTFAVAAPRTSPPVLRPVAVGAASACGLAAVGTYVAAVASISAVRVVVAPAAGLLLP